eukprot:UN14183
MSELQTSSIDINDVLNEPPEIVEAPSTTEVAEITSSTTDRKTEETPLTKKEVMENLKLCYTVTKENMKEFVGPRIFSSDRTYEDNETPPSGVVMGLAYSTMGGLTIFLETVTTGKATNGAGILKCTGKLGEVMQESADIAHIVDR